MGKWSELEATASGDAVLPVRYGPRRKDPPRREDTNERFARAGRS
jgi:hypothetical protein